MTNWYEITAKYPKTMDNGKVKKVSDKYLVSAVCVADAERVVVEDLSKYISEEIEISSAVQKPIAEIFKGDPDTCETWYKCKVLFMVFDEKTGAEKKVPSLMMVLAKDFDDAVAVLKKGMEGTMADWCIGAIQETAIIDVYGE